MNSAPRFIVSHYLFAEHNHLADAEKELKRLSQKFKKKRFRIYCVAGDFTPPLEEVGRKPKDMRNKLQKSLASAV